MTTLTLRHATEKDADLMVGLGLVLSYFRSENVDVFLCFENGKAVGLSAGETNFASQPGVCRLTTQRLALPNRFDIILALIERQAQHGVDLKQMYASMYISASAQDCNRIPTAVLMDKIKTTVSNDVISFAAEGAVGCYRANTRGLVEVVKEVGKALDAMGCVRKWE